MPIPRPSAAMLTAGVEVWNDRITVKGVGGYRDDSSFLNKWSGSTMSFARPALLARTPDAGMV